MKRFLNVVPLLLEIPSPTLPETVVFVLLDLSLQCIVTFCPSATKPLSFNFVVNESHVFLVSSSLLKSS